LGRARRRGSPKPPSRAAERPAPSARSLRARGAPLSLSAASRRPHLLPPLGRVREPLPPSRAGSPRALARARLHLHPSGLTASRLGPHRSSSSFGGTRSRASTPRARGAVERARRLVDRRRYEPAALAHQEPAALDYSAPALGADPQLEDEAYARPYPSAHWAGDLELKGPGRRPPHSVHSHRVFHAAHELKAGRGFKNPAQCRPTVKIFNQKVKEKDKE